MNLQDLLQDTSGVNNHNDDDAEAMLAPDAPKKVTMQ